MQALGKNVLLKKQGSGEQQVGSILLPGRGNENHGEILSVGSDVPKEFELKVGDIVIYNGGKQVTINGEHFISSSYEELLVKVKEAAK